MNLYNEVLDSMGYNSQIPASSIDEGVLLFLAWLEGVNSEEIVSVGVGGGSCSGKSTLATILKELLGERVSILHGDHYFSGPIGKNYDHPDCYNLEAVNIDLYSLKKGQTIKHPTYCKSTQKKGTRKVMSLDPGGVVIFEGLYALHHRVIAEIDYSIFMDAPLELAKGRRVYRDMEYESETEKTILDKWEHAEKAFINHVSETRSAADLLIRNGISKE